QGVNHKCVMYLKNFLGLLSLLRLRRPIPGWQQVGLQALAARRRVRLQLDLRHAPTPTVQRRVLDPLPHLPVAAQEASDCEAGPACLGVEEARTLAAGAAVTVDQAKLALAHLPALLRDLDEKPVPHDLGRAVAVEVDPHSGCLYYGGCGRKKSRNGRAP